jgi:response regulator RpfG family c-di-GMP phosphodiesterase
VCSSDLEELAALNADLEARVTARTTELAAANEAIKRHYLKSIKVFSNLIELRSGLLAGHGRRTADAARDIARKMGLAEDEVLRIFVSGLLHDVGLIGDSDGLMSKPLPRYTDDERARYLTHPAAGEQSLLALDDMQPLMPIIRGHHERFDGQGFPDKLAGAQIPLGARILAVADHFDELQNGHLAAQPLTRKEARTMMRHGRGTQFDPEILDVFLHITEPEKPKVEPMLALPTAALELGMVLAKDLVSARGVLMLARGHRLTGSLIARVREFELREGSRFTVHVQPRSAT